MHTPVLVWAVVATVTITIGGSAWAQTPSFTLDLAATPAQEVTLTVRPGPMPVTILRSGTTPTDALVNLALTPFSNEQGVTADVRMSVAGKTDAPAHHVGGVAFNTPALSLILHVPELPAGGKYTGRLILTTPVPVQPTAPLQAPVQGQPEGLQQPSPTHTGTPPTIPAPTVWRFTLLSANDLRPATLVIAPQGAITLTAVRAWCFLTCLGHSDAPVVTVQVHDKTRTWPLDGVMVQVESGLKTVGPGFDLTKHLSASFEGTDKIDLFTTPKAGERKVEAGGQAMITLIFRDLAVGEYTIPLRFTALNSSEDTLQRLTLTLQVRHNVFGAIVILVLAAFLSFLATRVVTMLRQRASFLERVRAMRPNWLTNEPATLPVIWLRATLRQTEDLSKRYWLTGQDAIDAKLTGAQGMLTVLDRVRQVRGRIELIPEAGVRRRARWKLDTLIHALGAAPLTEQDVTRYQAELDKLEEWTDSNKKEGAYWGEVLPRIRGRWAEVQIQGIPPKAQALAESLLKTLDDVATTTPITWQEKIAAEEAYARLTILWELRQDEAPVEQLVALTAQGRVEDFYKIADEYWWNRLKELAMDRWTIEGPPAGGMEPLEAYAPITFRCTIPSEPQLSGSFLVQKKLTYAWVIDVQAYRRVWWLLGLHRQLMPGRKLYVTSAEPQVAQYAPRAGTMQARLEITYEADDGPSLTQPHSLTIGHSSDFRAQRAFEMADLLALSVVLLTSIISGIALYALTPTFGSLKDYLALFTWGASLDQGKYFLQSLAIYKKT